MVTKDDDSINPEWQEQGQSGTVVLGGTLLEQLANVIAVGSADGDIISFDFLTKTWVNVPGTGAAAPVTSVFGRIGVVVAVEGDYILDQLGDVLITTPQNDDLLVYDSGNNRWVNDTPTISAPVQSVFGRTGVVGALIGDYDAIQVDYDPTASSLTSTNTQGAIDQLDVNVEQNATDIGDKADLVHTHNPSEALAEPITTGLTDGGILTGVSATTFQITGGNGFILDSYTDYQNTVTTPVTWITQTLNLLNPATEFRTYVSIDNTGTVVLSNIAPSPALERTSIVIGSLFHDPAQVANPTPIQDYHQIGTMGHALIDYWDFIGLIGDGLGLEANVGVLTTKRLSGRIFSFGINENVDPTNPNVADISELDPFVFRYILGDGSIPTGTLISVFDPLNFDPGGAGVLQAVSAAAGGIRTTIQWVFALAPGISFVLYGQTEHDDLTTALEQILVDRSNLVIPTELNEAFGPLFAIGMRQGATDMSLDTDAFLVSFLENTGGGGGGGGASGVITWKDRTGDVVPLPDDYTASEVTNVPAGNILATDVQAALDELDADLTTVINAAVTELDDLTDVTIIAEVADQVIVNNGLGVFINALLKAAQVSNEPLGNITATNVQDALSELDGFIFARPRISVQATPPTVPAPIAGDLWWDTDDTDGTLHIYYIDVDSAQWVPTTPALGGAGSAFSGAMLRKVGDQALVANTPEFITFEGEEYDVGGWHDNATNNTRLTVPAGLTGARIITGCTITDDDPSATSNQLVASIKRNGLSEAILPGINTATSAADQNSLSSGPIVVTAGDFFELEGAVGASASIVAVDTNFWIRVVEGPALGGSAGQTVGDFSPTALFGGASVGVTYDADTYGRFIQTGKIVWIHGRLQLTSKGSSTGEFRLSGFPFTLRSNPSGPGGAGGGEVTAFVSMSAMDGKAGLHGIEATSEFTVRTIVNTQGDGPIDNTNFTDTTLLDFEATFEID